MLTIIITVDNRTNILKIALRLFSDRGYASVGIQEIVTESKVTKPTLYHYFGSKRGLLDSLLEENFKNLKTSLQVATDYKRDLPNSLYKITRTFFNFVKENELFYRLQLSLCFSSLNSEAYKAVEYYNNSILKMLEDMFTAASNDHGNMKGRQKRYAFTFLGMINNYITLYLFHHTDLNDEIIYQAVHQFSHGIYS